MPSENAHPIPRPGIGLLRETSLHAALKAWYAQEGDIMEVLVDGYVIDIVRDKLLIEIQTRSFSSLKAKLVRLVQDHPVHLVYPIAQVKWIVRVAADGKSFLTRRRSPRRGRVEYLFKELVHFPALVNRPNFSMEILFTQEEEIWQDDGKGSWRRKGWSIADHRLLQVLDRVALLGPQDFQALLPAGLPTPFTTRDLAHTLALPRPLAQKMVYCLREMEILEWVGKQGQARLYSPLYRQQVNPQS